MHAFLRQRCLAILLIIAFSIANANHASAQVQFQKVALPTTNGKQYTTVTIGPDGKLYATANDGEIRRWPILADGTVGSVQIIQSLRTTAGGNRLLIGLVFDPAATADNLIAWVTHSFYGFDGMADWGGKITRLSGPNLENVQDYVVDLPRSSRDHVTNGITFGPDGAIYFLQGANATMGAPDGGWANRSEHTLTAAVLRLDPTLIGSPPLNVRTSDGGSYNPYAPSAPLTIYASGIRNPYDLVWHSNGWLYISFNGSASGGNLPAATPGAPCANGSTYSGPSVSAQTNVPEKNDYLVRVTPGGYYGHPNPTRCEFVMNGGNPTNGTDPAQVTTYPVGTQPDPNFRGFAYDFGLHRSPDGIIEYRSCLFGGALKGKLLVVRYSQGDDIMVLTPGGPSQDITTTQTGITGFTGFSDPLDLTEDRRTGNIYVAEYAPSASRITLLRPTGTPGTAIISGDIDDDCDVDFNDMSAFVTVLIDSPLNSAHVSRADLNNDQVSNGLDIAPFVTAILTN